MFRFRLLGDKQCWREGKLNYYQQREAQVHLQRAHNTGPGRQNLPHALKHLQLDLVSSRNKVQINVVLIRDICSKFYPYYSASDEKWKNSIRHNLSLYPEFVKGEKTTDGAGHLWYLDQDFRRNYLQQREERMRRKSEQMNEVLRHKNVEALVEDVMEEEEMKVKEAGTFYHEEAKYRDLITTPELQKSAEEILAGIKRPTAVIGNECFLENYSFIATQDILDREAWLRSWKFYRAMTKCGCSDV